MRTQTAKNALKKEASSKTSFKSGKVVKKKAVVSKKVVATKTGTSNKSPKTNPKTKTETSENESNQSSSSNSECSHKTHKKVKKQATAKKVSQNTLKCNTKKKFQRKVLVSAAESSVNKTKATAEKNIVKYKLSKQPNVKTTVKAPKTKKLPKKLACNVQNKKCNRKQDDQKESVPSISIQINEEIISKQAKQDISQNEGKETDKTIACQNNTTSNTANIPTSSKPIAESPKLESERPMKFFTSNRSPRTVDIDVKFCKSSKSTISLSERFLSMKCETKSDDSNKDKMSSNTLVSQGSDADVYTFTEKVDSPKSILSDFRNPITKNVGRVRPIARVKGTIIDTKTNTDKKKYSPHRPIEEVVKQLKANKKPDISEHEQEINVFKCVTVTDINKDEDDKPKPIISKSYKMVARKSSVTGKPFSPTKFLEQNTSGCNVKQEKNNLNKKNKSKSNEKKCDLSDDDMETSKFSINTKYSSTDDHSSESNDDNYTKESSNSESSCSSKSKSKQKKSKGSKTKTKPAKLDKNSRKRPKLQSMWSGPKKHRMASLNALAKVHCLYENESRTHMELGLMKTVDRQMVASTSKMPSAKKKETKSKESEQNDTTSESEYDNRKKTDSSESSDDSPPQRSLRVVPGIRSAGKYWDLKSSTSSSEDSELEYRNTTTSDKKKSPKTKPNSEKPEKLKKTIEAPAKKKRNRNELVMDLKDMVVQKRMASLNATAILAASYEKRSSKSSKDGSTSDSCSDESFVHKSKNGVASDAKSEGKIEKTQTDNEETADNKPKVEVIVNQDTDVTITGVYSTHHHEGFCTVSGMQYRISSTSHTQTTATANCDKEGCREETKRYTPLSALSSMQPPADQAQPHPELGGLSRRGPGSSAFSAPSPAHHHDSGYYQPAGPLIKEGAVDAERALVRYHPSPHHYHTPHPSVVQHYGGGYYPAELCYGRYYRPPNPYHPPPAHHDPQMVGAANDPYPPQYYGTPPCYQHSSPRVPYIEYRGCPCPLNACPKNVHIGPATGKARASGGPDAPTAPPGAVFRQKARVANDATVDAHAVGKDPVHELEPPAAADAPHPCVLPAIGGASPKREFYDVRDNLRLVDHPGPTEVLGPPSPARGSAGICAPQPPPIAPRKARLGKAMVRRNLTGDDTGHLLTAGNASRIDQMDTDDDVVVISPPMSAPIDLSSSDERTTPLVDVKKENEGPTYASLRKTDAQALREHNSKAPIVSNETTKACKAVKRRYSRHILDIEMKDVHLEESCKTNGISEHVKLQKRRKISEEHSDSFQINTVQNVKIKSPKKSTSNPSTPEKKQRMFLKLKTKNEPKLNKALNIEEKFDQKSLMLLKPEQMKQKDKLIVQESLISNNLQTSTVVTPPNGVQHTTVAAVSNFLGKKLSSKISSKKNHTNNNIRSIEKSETKRDKTHIKNNYKKLHPKLNGISERETLKPLDKIQLKQFGTNNYKCKLIHQSPKKTQETTTDFATDKSAKPPDTAGNCKSKHNNNIAKDCCESLGSIQPAITDSNKTKSCDKSIGMFPVKRSKLMDKKETKRKMVEKVAKLLVSKKSAIKVDEATMVIEDACSSPTPSACRVGGKRARRRKSGVRGRKNSTPLDLPTLEHRGPPRWSNGWKWDGESYVSKVYMNNDSRLDRVARCWSSMVHEGGDKLVRGDCVLLRATSARAAPFVARLASLWENPDDGEMMVSLVWYYRPEHTAAGRVDGDAHDEVFASRHRDANSVACIEDKCYVLNYNEYCRYRKRLKATEEGITITPSIVPPMPASEVYPAISTNDSKLPASVSPDLVLFCRKIYDFRSKKLQVPNK